jgi:hypothetical protein
MKILLYSDSQLVDLEWAGLLRWPDHAQVEIKHNFVEYRDQSADYKIAITSHRLNCDYDQNCAAYQGFEEKIINLSDVSDLVFSLESELHNYHWIIWNKCHRPNVYWLLPGAVNDQDDMNANIIYWGDWFKTTKNLYHALPEVLAQLTPYKTKPRMFDALLGCPKPHRTFVAEAVAQHKLQDQFILTYGGSWQDTEFYARDYFIWEPGCVPEAAIIGTADWVQYHGHQCHLSQVIPQQVYNDTAYSIVAETDHDNTLSFYSEKTSKAFIARRLFVAFSGYKFLHNLHTLGFQTFGTVIDESYDLIKNDQERYTAAFEQVRWLCSQPQQQVLETIQPVLEHNHNLIMNTDWNFYARTRVQDLIDTLCNRL